MSLNEFNTAVTRLSRSLLVAAGLFMVGLNAFTGVIPLEQLILVKLTILATTSLLLILLLVSVKHFDFSATAVNICLPRLKNRI